MIAEGQRIVRECLRRNQPGPYQIQAAISAVHSDAATAARTDWRQVLALYDQLLAVAPTPVVALNRDVAVAEVHGPAAALESVDGLAPRRLPPVPRDPRGPAAPARPRPRRPRPPTTPPSICAENAAERRFLTARRDSLDR